MKLKWLYSYETVKFDTADGDLDKGQCALFKGDYMIRDKPKNNSQPTILRTKDDRGKTVDVSDKIKGLELVKILDGEHCYYDVFELDDGRLFRVLSNEKAYKDLAIKNSPSVEKDMTEQEVLDIYSDDINWKKIKEKDVSN